MLELVTVDLILVDEALLARRSALLAAFLVTVTTTEVVDVAVVTTVDVVDVTVFVATVVLTVDVGAVNVVVFVGIGKF